MLNAKFLVPVAILVALLGPTRTWAQRITGPRHWRLPRRPRRNQIFQQIKCTAVL